MKAKAKPRKKKGDDKPASPEPKKPRKKKQPEVEVNSEDDQYDNMKSLEKSQGVMMIQKRVIKQWEKAEERARKALEKARLKEANKKKRTGKNWMKKVIPRLELPEIKESPYLPLETALAGGIIGTTKKKGSAEIMLPDYPEDKSDVLTCNREMLHAVMANDIARVKKIIGDTKHVSNIFQAYSVASPDLNAFWLSVELRR